MGIVFGGQAFGGIFASVTQVIVILLGVEPADAAFFCFLVAVIFLGTALLCFVVATRSDFFNFYLDERKTGDPAQVSEDPDELKGKFLNNDVDFQQPAKVSPWIVFKTIWMYALSVFLIFTVTLACFPAITAQVESSSLPPRDERKGINEEDYEWGLKFFIPVACFVLFNVGDWLGRFFAEMFQWPKPGRFGMIFVLIFTLARLAFIPLFLFSNANPGGRIQPVVFGHDAYYILFMALFSLSNGYLSSICMMSAPQLCKGTEAQTAASMMVALLGLGLGAGSLTSNFIKNLL